MERSKVTFNSMLNVSVASAVSRVFLVPGSSVFAEGEIVSNDFLEFAKFMAMEPPIGDLNTYEPVSFLYPQLNKKTNPDDMVFCFKRSATVGNEFGNMIEAWLSDKRTGLAQFKINKGMHTFVVEKLHDANGNPLFRLYQAYQGTYTLNHFLGLKIFSSQKAAEERAFFAMFNVFGKGKTYSPGVMKMLLFDKLVKGLKSEMGANDYATCLGSVSSGIELADIEVRIVPIAEKNNLNMNLNKLRYEKILKLNSWPGNTKQAENPNANADSASKLENRKIRKVEKILKLIF
ncbi:MAG: hypothetical protein GY754_47130 [bacterium]|nr:hypothetical protein [bacterium]